MTVARRHVLSPILLLAFVAAAPTPAAAAESYESCTHFISTVPTVIGTQGVYCFTGDINTKITTGNAIDIQVNNVTIDCNGFKLGGIGAGNLSVATGINSDSRLNHTVRDCAIRGFHRGILLGGSGSGHLVEGNRLDANLAYGIYVGGSQNMVRDNRVLDTGGYGLPSAAMGILVYGDAIDNVVDGVHGNGSLVTGLMIGGAGSIARGNRVRTLTGGNMHVGINVADFQNALVDNVVVNLPEEVGRGIWANGVGQTFCSGNLVSGFTTEEITACSLVAGNHTH